MPTDTLPHLGSRIRHRARRATTRIGRPADVAIAVVRRYGDEDAGTLAAGIALFSIIALPALIIAFVATYGLVTTPRDVWQQVDWLARHLPEGVTGFLRGQMDRAAETASGTLTFAAVSGVFVALYVGHNAVSSTINVLNRIYGLRECRSFVRRHLLALALTAGLFVLAVAALTILVALPGIAAWLGWNAAIWDVIRAARWPFAFALITGVLTVFFRSAPCESRVGWRHAAIGAAVTAVLWLVISALFSWYATRVVDYEAMYGAAGGVIVLLLWFYLAAAALLLGGLVSAELGKPAAVPSTAAPAAGPQGAPHAP
jgi:membrane protein